MFTSDGLLSSSFVAYIFRNLKIYQSLIFVSNKSEEHLIWQLEETTSITTTYEM